MHLAERPLHATSTSATSSRVREVDALRGIAALLVLLFHYTHRYAEMFPGAQHPDFTLNAGYDGVVLFFALSGFSIHFSFRKLAHVGDFVFARFARLYPAYWAAMAITVVVQACADIPQFRLPSLDMLVNLTMLQGFAHNVGLVDGAYWTLAVELCFYACMATLWRLGLLARLEWLLGGWLALAFVMQHWSGFPEPVVQFLVLRHIHFFAIGLISSRVHAGHRTWRQQMPIMAITILYIWAVDGFEVLLVATSALAFFAAMTAGRIRWICVRPLLWVGAISYPLYLVHQHVGMTIMAQASAAGRGYWEGLAVATLVALILGSAIHRLIERPAGDWLLARWKRFGAEAHMPALATLTSGKPRLNELDALRGIGAILVMNFHYSTRFAELFPRSNHVPFHLFSGNYRVMLFFAISGFAIFFTLRNLRRTSDFVAGRFARLFPAYWAAILLTLAVEYLGSAPQLTIPLADVAINLTMLQAYFYVPPVDGAYWTLALELGFYACMLTLWIIGFVKRIEIVLVAWLFGKWVLHYWAAMPTPMVEIMVLDWVPFFAIGMLSYRVWSGERRWRDQLPIIFVMLLTVAKTSTPDLILATVAIAATFAAMVEGRLGWLCVRPLLWLGSISYSLYLVHQHIGFVIMLNSDRFGLSPLLGYALACVAAVALGAILNRLVERPGSELILRWWRGRRSTPSKMAASLSNT
ncbi:MAG TPA: acyltransferase [Sphingobium sp.]|uniref:acyltransferase family protein n=1 Tax=Sphingobium sp. TaxID=1912891 RepID=UPI002ED5942E